MVVAYPPFYPQQILDADGKPVAGGRILSFYAGTDVPLAMFAPDGTSLGSSVSIASDGSAVFCLKVGTSYKLVCVDANGATVWTRDKVKISAGDGMANPMESPGDLIVGGPDGDPLRRGVGEDGDILAVALYGGGLSPVWEGGPKKYRKVFSYVPSPLINDGYLGNLFYLSGYAQTLELPSAANIPSKSFIDFVFLDNAASLAITPQSNTVLNGQNSSITIGGQSASFYRLTFLGRGDVGGVQTDQWALGGGLANGDHKTAVDGSDTSPDYLAAKLAAGTGISLTNTGSAVSIAADAQSGDHHVVVTGADASAGTLADKLVAGSNITLTTNTDGDGVQTLEIAATGGGGGGGSDWDIVPPINNRRYSTGKQYFAIARPVCPLGNTIRSIAFALAPYNSSYSPGVSVTGEIAVYTLNPATDNLWGNAATRIAQKTFSQTIVSPVVWASFDADVDVSDKTKVYAVAVSINRPVAGFTIQLILEHAWGSDGASVPVERHWGDNAHIALNSSMTFSSSTGENFQYWLGVSSRNLG